MEPYGCAACGEVVIEGDSHATAAKPCKGPKRKFAVLVEITARGLEVPDIGHAVDFRLNDWEDIEECRVTGVNEEKS